MEYPWKSIAEGLLVTVRLTPKGGRDSLDGIVLDANDLPAIKARVAAPPTDGAANKALVKLLAKSCASRNQTFGFAAEKRRGLSACRFSVIQWI